MQILEILRESPDEREVRVDRLRANQRERLAGDSQDEREARLERTNTNQRQRSARVLG